MPTKPGSDASVRVPCTTSVVHEHKPLTERAVDEESGRPFMTIFCKDCNKWLGDRMLTH